MEKTIKFQDGTVQDFCLNRNGFIEAVSYKESSAKLKLSINHSDNLKAASAKSSGGHRGFFQMGESALFETGYYLGDTGIDFRKLDSKKEKDQIKIIQNTFNKNDWRGKWTGKNGITSLHDFIAKPELQLMAVSDWINYLCERMRKLDFNQYYGQIINGVEVTESGAIASAHLMGEGGLATFLGSPIFKQKYPVSDGNGTHISLYLSMFGGFDLESCCKRKIYITLKDSSGLELKNKEVTIVSQNNGKYISGETRVNVKSDDKGNLPVIVRNPNTEIKIVADGKESNTIVQKANEKQKATLSDFKISSYSATLEKESTPQPKPQVNKTPQEVRNEQVESAIPQEAESMSVSKDVNFNIQIVEGDTGKAISNMNFFLTYKGNIKKHTADNTGIKKGIIAEEGQDIEVSVEGDGNKQVIHHFQVTSALKNQMVKVRLPVHSFNISVTQDGKKVPNTIFSLFYRGREIPKRTNASGVIKIRMLTGFVFGFGIKGKSLVLSRVEKSSPTKPFTVNGSAVRASKLYEVADAKRKEAESLKKQQQKDAQEKKAKEEAEKAKTDVDKTNQTKQNNTYTENSGKPLTIISDQSPPTSDTTRYHIYHDGKIKRENKAATGFAEFIYYDQNGKTHNLGKSNFNIANRWVSKGKKGTGSVYLIDQRKHKQYKMGNIGYLWRIDSDDGRYYLSGTALSAVLGAMCSLGYAEYTGSGFSCRDGSPGDSVSHLNGENGDFRYIAINNRHMSELTYTSHKHFDWDKNVSFVNALYKFGYKLFGSNPVKIKENMLLPHSKSWSGHHNHVHLHDFNPNVEDI
ncbi:MULTISPECIES: hypothetical protein [unclassified Acinetobacter]|uniref:hypothetical protein n=1 Tax=unclassified Acinetobacter TaxID=196816 RepID=UPI002447DA9B|nr:MULTISPECIES: hypothetical protein [unclassified Acinetobacter]MDH0032491.1 hypothetical protein [Acinetobacter sp. GD04021]MDH0888082.1 hypothetical protein [Acinetobacter sp. GD03873]MDH1084366.1 hypothetical protein [Acinetobacter sp. GD03983]MDH2191403.1 hypothetical protein [Acinetobacter sp. GD03645]MDH2204936.1 hypothetical protein [Acinetobacter sp. GD03647]